MTLQVNPMRSIVRTVCTPLCTISRLKRKSHLYNLRGKGKGSLQCKTDELSDILQETLVLLSPSLSVTDALFDSFINATG
jgi:hypothetical protein